jgi:flavin-binding protein dodecin
VSTPRIQRLTVICLLFNDTAVNSAIVYYTETKDVQLTIGAIMSHTYKVIELVGSSPISSDEAVKNAIAEANKSLLHLRWFQVIETRGHLEEGLIAHWQVTIKVGFTLDSNA